MPLLPWIKRHILPHAGRASAGFAFHTEETARASEPRREEACAICGAIGLPGDTRPSAPLENPGARRDGSRAAQPGKGREGGGW